MHIHLPKPLHGWRVFVGEVAIIVLGVLIALVRSKRFNRSNGDKRSAPLLPT